MKKEKFEGATVRSAGLFSTGSGGRHDWMRFHAHDVNCPKKTCPGILLWKTMGNVLECSFCKGEFILKPKKKVKREGR